MLLRAKGMKEDAAQIFIKSNRRWDMAGLAQGEGEAFRRGKKEMDLWVCAHAGYLINPAGAEETRKKSILSLAAEMQRAEELELEAVVVHCGSRGDLAPREARRRAVEGFREALQRSKTERVLIALENSAGQGSSMACEVAEWGEMVASLPKSRQAACLDTAHAFAAGHDLRTEEGRGGLIQEVEQGVGLAKVVVIHANDSKSECGSKVDRHEHLGRGKIGASALRKFLRNPAWSEVPRIGELPPGEREDRENLAFLRSCGPCS